MAIKIIMAKLSSAANRELVVHRHLDFIGCDDHPGYNHVLRLLHEFYVDGPNGTHLCIVSHVLGPNAASIADAYPNHRLGERLVRSVSRQLLFAVGYLHEAGIVHGDIHPRNVLFRLPEIDEMDLTLEIAEEFFGALVVKATGQCGPDSSAPAYLISPGRFNRANPRSFHKVQLINLGECTESQTLCIVLF